MSVKHYIYKYKKLNFSYSPIFEYIISKDKVFWCGDEIAYSWINGNILEEKSDYKPIQLLERIA